MTNKKTGSNVPGIHNTELSSVKRLINTDIFESMFKDYNQGIDIASNDHNTLHGRRIQVKELLENNSAMSVLHDTPQCIDDPSRYPEYTINHFHSPNPRRDALIPPLRGKRVVVVGLGGGAPIPIELLKCGVDVFDLVDFDILEPHNAIRHPCPAKYFGLPKVEAVAGFMREFAGSQVSINSHVIDVFKHHDTMKDLIRNADLLIVATDSEASRFFLNEIAVETKTPAVYVGMYENGSGGEIFAAIPGQACYACLCEYNQRKAFIQQYQAATRKGDCSSTRDTMAMPGLGIDQGMLALIAARKSVEILLRGVQHSLPPAGGNWIVFSIFGITKILESPLTCFQGDLAQHSKCFACGNPY